MRMRMLQLLRVREELSTPSTFCPSALPGSGFSIIQAVFKAIIYLAMNYRLQATVFPHFSLITGCRCCTQWRHGWWCWYTLWGGGWACLVVASCAHDEWWWLTGTCPLSSACTHTTSSARPHTPPVTRWSYYPRINCSRQPSQQDVTVVRTTTLSLSITNSRTFPAPRAQDHNHNIRVDARLLHGSGPLWHYNSFNRRAVQARNGQPL